MKTDKKTQFKISEEKLQRKDTYRVQTQHKSRENKIVYAVIYGFISDNYHDNAKPVRDYQSDKVTKKVMKVFGIIMNSDPKAKAEFSKWLDQNVDPKLHKEITQIVNKYK